MVLGESSFSSFVSRASAAKCLKRGPFESKSGVAWVQTLAELRKEARQSRQLAVQVIEKALCLQCGTATVERWLGESCSNGAQEESSASLQLEFRTSYQIELAEFEGGDVLGWHFSQMTLLRGLCLRLVVLVVGFFSKLVAMG